jgi:sugar O-acyltransferase (sialic acid O-acetyltransferase NeuD family)
MRNLIIIGAGGFGLEVAAYAEDMTRHGVANIAVTGFLDDTKPAGTHHGGLPVLGPTDAALDPHCVYIIAVGTPEHRQTLAEKLWDKNATLASLRHPLSYVAADAQIGAGTIIAPFAFVGPMTQMGRNCLLNIYASAGHESRIGEHCVLAPYAGTHGQAQLGNGVLLGSHAAVTRGVSIGDGTKVAAGAVCYNDVPDGALAIGNPAGFRARE